MTIKLARVSNLSKQTFERQQTNERTNLLYLFISSSSRSTFNYSEKRRERHSPLARWKERSSQLFSYCFNAMTILSFVHLMMMISQSVSQSSFASSNFFQSDAERRRRRKRNGRKRWNVAEAERKKCERKNEGVNVREREDMSLINAIICTCISQKRKRHIVDGISSQQTTRIFFFVLIHINFLSRLDYFHRLWLMRHVQKSSMFEFQRCSSRSIGNSHVLWTSTTFSPVIILSLIHIWRCRRRG